MAEPSLLQRGFKTMREAFTALRTGGDGENKTGALGRAQRKGEAKSGGADGVGQARVGARGLSETDAYDDGEDERRRRRARQMVMGNQEAEVVATPNTPERDLQQLAPEFRAQIVGGLAAANSFTAGSTLAAQPGFDDPSTTGRW